MSFASLLSQWTPSWEIIIPLLWGKISSHVDDNTAILDRKKRRRLQSWVLALCFDVLLIGHVFSNLVQAGTAEKGRIRGESKKHVKREGKDQEKKGKRNYTVTTRKKKDLNKVFSRRQKMLKRKATEKQREQNVKKNNDI